MAIFGNTISWFWRLLLLEHALHMSLVTVLSFLSEPYIFNMIPSPYIRAQIELDEAAPWVQSIAHEANFLLYYFSNSPWNINISMEFIYMLPGLISVYTGSFVCSVSWELFDAGNIQPWSWVCSQKQPNKTQLWSMGKISIILDSSLSYNLIFIPGGD
jgi:hypothetical protein